MPVNAGVSVSTASVDSPASTAAPTSPTSPVLASTGGLARSNSIKVVKGAALPGALGRSLSMRSSRPKSMGLASASNVPVLEEAPKQQPNQSQPNEKSSHQSQASIQSAGVEKQVAPTLAAHEVKSVVPSVADNIGAEILDTKRHSHSTPNMNMITPSFTTSLVQATADSRLAAISETDLSPPAKPDMGAAGPIVVKKNQVSLEGGQSHEPSNLPLVDAEAMVSKLEAENMALVTRLTQLEQEQRDLDEFMSDWRAKMAEIKELQAKSRRRFFTVSISIHKNQEVSEEPAADRDVNIDSSPASQSTSVGHARSRTEATPVQPSVPATIEQSMANIVIKNMEKRASISGSSSSSTSAMSSAKMLVLSMVRPLETRSALRSPISAGSDRIEIFTSLDHNALIRTDFQVTDVTSSRDLVEDSEEDLNRSSAANRAEDETKTSSHNNLLGIRASPISLSKSTGALDEKEVKEDATNLALLKRSFKGSGSKIGSASSLENPKVRPVEVIRDKNEFNSSDTFESEENKVDDFAGGQARITRRASKRGLNITSAIEEDANEPAHESRKKDLQSQEEEVPVAPVAIEVIVSDEQIIVPVAIEAPKTEGLKQDTAPAPQVLQPEVVSEKIKEALQESITPPVPERRAPKSKPDFDRYESSHTFGKAASRHILRFDDRSKTETAESSLSVESGNTFGIKSRTTTSQLLEQPSANDIIDNYAEASRRTSEYQPVIGLDSKRSTFIVDDIIDLVAQSDEKKPELPTIEQEKTTQESSSPIAAETAVLDQAALSIEAAAPVKKLDGSPAEQPKIEPVQAELKSVEVATETAQQEPAPQFSTHISPELTPQEVQAPITEDVKAARLEEKPSGASNEDQKPAEQAQSEQPIANAEAPPAIVTVAASAENLAKPSRELKGSNGSLGAPKTAVPAVSSEQLKQKSEVATGRQPELFKSSESIKVGDAHITDAPKATARRRSSTLSRIATPKAILEADEQPVMSAEAPASFTVPDFSPNSSLSRPTSVSGDGLRRANTRRKSNTKDVFALLKEREESQAAMTKMISQINAPKPLSPKAIDIREELKKASLPKLEANETNAATDEDRKPNLSPDEIDYLKKIGFTDLLSVIGVPGNSSNATGAQTAVPSQEQAEKPVEKERRVSLEGESVVTSNSALVSSEKKAPPVVKPKPTVIKKPGEKGIVIVTDGSTTSGSNLALDPHHSLSSPTSPVTDTNQAPVSYLTQNGATGLGRKGSILDRMRFGQQKKESTPVSSSGDSSNVAEVAKAKIVSRFSAMFEQKANENKTDSNVNLANPTSPTGGATGLNRSKTMAMRRPVSHMGESSSAPFRPTRMRADTAGSTNSDSHNLAPATTTDTTITKEVAPIDASQQNSNTPGATPSAAAQTQPPPVTAEKPTGAFGLLRSKTLALRRSSEDKDAQSNFKLAKADGKSNSQTRPRDPTSQPGDASPSNTNSSVPVQSSNQTDVLTK